MYYGAIDYSDIANGEGVRVTLFVSGCTNRCEGCFQPETRSFTYGKPYTMELEDSIIEALKKPYIAGLTLLGGEPFEPENQAVLLPLIKRVRKEVPSKNIWSFTGFLFEELKDPSFSKHCDETDEILSLLDVLIDGPFVLEKRNISLKFRGSENQRVIDVKETLKTGKVTLYLE
ncbi:MAG: anaerobic ribonucleoside-triphosphate reductase activating protein [Clostridiales bacterium]|nr:anaerobic ribonucleoside-triphosphate reductase activating protein [Clostridiales bacterium]